LVASALKLVLTEQKARRRHDRVRQAIHALGRGDNKHEVGDERERLVVKIDFAFRRERSGGGHGVASEAAILTADHLSTRQWVPSSGAQPQSQATRWSAGFANQKRDPSCP
jgi:hypothetical protein